MTYIGIETYASLNFKYQKMIEYHATIIYNNDVHNEFSYHDQKRTLDELFEKFRDKEIANDIYLKFIDLAREDGYLCESSY